MDPICAPLSSSHTHLHALSMRDAATHKGTLFTVLACWLGRIESSPLILHRAAVDQVHMETVDLSFTTCIYLSGGMEPRVTMETVAPLVVSHGLNTPDWRGGNRRVEPSILKSGAAKRGFLFHSNIHKWALWNFCRTLSLKKKLLWCLMLPQKRRSATFKRRIPDARARSL